MESELIQFLIANGYWIMFLLMIVEGPIVTMAAAFLASLGFFSWPLVFLVSICGDLTGDVLWYSIGRKWGTAFVNGPGRFIGMKPSLIKKMDRYFDTYGGRTIFLVKSTTGLCLVTFVAAGIARMDMKKFLSYSLLGGIVWSGTLTIAGYFFGFLYEEIAQVISWAGWLILGIAIGFFVGMNFYKKYRARKHGLHIEDIVQEQITAE